jgi:hypothetical protein
MAIRIVFLLSQCSTTGPESIPVTRITTVWRQIAANANRMPRVTLLSQSAKCINWLIPLALPSRCRRLSTGFSTDCVEHKKHPRRIERGDERAGGCGLGAKKR